MFATIYNDPASTLILRRAGGFIDNSATGGFDEDCNRCFVDGGPVEITGVPLPPTSILFVSGFLSMASGAWNACSNWCIRFALTGSGPRQCAVTGAQR